MNKTFIIIQREFLTRVKKRSFILLTLLMPLLFVALGAVPFLLGKIEDKEQKRVVVVDKTGLYSSLFATNESYRYEYASKVLPEHKDPEGEVEAVIEITTDLATLPAGLTIYSTREVQSKLIGEVEKTVEQRVRADKLSRQNISNLEEIVKDIDQAFVAKTAKWNKEGESSSSSSDLATFLGMFSTFFIYLFVMSYGSMVMQSVIEEKTSRIMEVMVSSVRPFQLLLGKIVGVALVGFLQMAIWGTTVALLLLGLSFLLTPEGALASAQGMGATSLPSTDPNALLEVAGAEGFDFYTALFNLPLAELGLLFVLYFIGGYLLFASFFAAMGASVNAPEDASQFTLPMVMVMMFGLYAAIGSAENTHGPLAFWASLFPLTSPIVMMVRIPFDVPLWQELLSLLLLYSSAFGMVWLSAKIYRVGILMYGKKPNFKEMLKWLRYK